MRLLGLSVFASIVAACSGQFGSRGEEPIVPFPSPRPTFGATVTQPRAPAPISGGTLLIARDGKTAFASDPDRDRVIVTDLDTAQTTSIALNEGDEPGRAVEDDGGRVHVALRRGGAIVTIDLATRSIVQRRALCAAPRGITWSSARSRLYVACAGGELIGVAADGEAPSVNVNLGRDLRDVVATSGGLWVTRFRSADLIRVSFEGVTGPQFKPPPRSSLAGTLAEPEVAWRMIPIAGDQVLTLHQRATAPLGEPISTSAGGYSEEGTPTGKLTPEKQPEPCGIGIVHSAITIANEFTILNSSPPIGRAVLAVDVAASMSPEDRRVAVVAAGNGHTPELAQILVFDSVTDTQSDCVRAPGKITPKGQAIAAAYRGKELVVQLREPAAIVRYDADLKEVATIPLGGESREDTGHAVFHSNSGGFMACASCHPEGGDDGHIWSFANLGPRRTQNLRGGVSQTAPFHWDGEFKDLSGLMGDVFAKRMSGGSLAADQVAALGKWVDTIPHLPQATAADAARVERGRVLFHDSTTKCSSCHSNIAPASVDVGTGGLFQVPSLRGIAFRAPFMHTGCAKTLADRFSAAECAGGDKHGVTSHLYPTQVGDLVAYLESL